MKHLVIMLAAILSLCACQADQEFGTRAAADLQLGDPQNIEIAEPLANVSYSYELDGTYQTADACTDDGAANYALATRGDLCMRLQITNTGSQTQTIMRRHFVLNIENLQGRTPTTLYKSNGRAVQYITLQSGATANITLYFQNLFGSLEPDWQHQQPDVNATYSIDLLLGSAANYLYGGNLYAYGSQTPGWQSR